MCNFKAGDRVKVNANCRWLLPVSAPAEGIMRGARKMAFFDIYEVAVEFPSRCGGMHTCGGLVKSEAGWWVPEFVLALAEDSPAKNKQKVRLIIEKDGDVTTARRVVGKTVTQTAEVRRYHADRDDERAAVGFVIDKLYGVRREDCCEASAAGFKVSPILWGAIIATLTAAMGMDEKKEKEDGKK